MAPTSFRAQPVADPLGAARVLEAPLQQTVKPVKDFVLEFLLSRTGLQITKRKSNTYPTEKQSSRKEDKVTM